MKNKITDKIISLFLALLLALSITVPSFAQDEGLDSSAYASIITASDFQAAGVDAYERFGNILEKIKADGLDNPDSLLIGGDYSMILPDYATPGVEEIRNEYTAVYPGESDDSMVFIQGNHDITSSAFVKTGFYDMGSYCLYAINEDDFPWKQYQNTTADKMAALAANIETSLNTMIDSGDTRPVIVMTHVPLHHSSRSDGRDNLYSSYVFKVLNKAAEKLDIVFLFGHNHSSTYDDYIGGAVNILKPGETIRIPTGNDNGAEDYTEETLNFTYANYGYVGYSNNGTDNGSTDVLTVGVIQFTENGIRFVRYSENGLFRTVNVQRKTTSAYMERTAAPEQINAKSLSYESKLCSNTVFRALYIVINKVIGSVLLYFS